ncbi:MAG: glycosyltransferase family 4 protein [Leptolyngbyaceae cyanobacterium]
MTHQMAVNQTSHRNILVITRTFFPCEGGIEEYIYNRCLQDPDKVVLLTANCAGATEFDTQQLFPIYRWWFPNWLPTNTWGSALKQLFNMIGAFVMALRLYARYPFRSIEWGHGYDFPTLLLLTYLLPTQTFMYLHGKDVLCPLKLPVIKRLFKLTLKRLNGVICNSSFTEQYLRSRVSQPLNTHVINPTVRPAKFGLNELESSLKKSRSNIRYTYAISDTATVLLSVGRLVKRKGFERVIAHLPGLLAQGLDVHYIICGRGAMQVELETLAQQLGVLDRVHFAGFVPDQALAHYYEACDVFVMLTSFAGTASIEGFGIVYVEAGYFGKPVLATNLGGVIDAVHHEENGLLVEPDDDNGIANALLRLCRDPQLRERLGQTGRTLTHRQTPHRLIYRNVAQ